MKLYQSRVGVVLGVLYLLLAAYVVRDELKSTGGGGWMNLRGLAFHVVTLPSQLTLGILLEALGVKVDFNRPGPGGMAQIVLHIALCAALVYLIGYGIERIARR